MAWMFNIFFSLVNCIVVTISVTSQQNDFKYNKRISNYEKSIWAIQQCQITLTAE